MKSAKVHYIHSLSYSARDKLVGAFVLIALLLLIGLFASKVKLSKIFDSVVHYQTILKNAQGITTETAINISGIDVGRVTDVNFRENNKVNIQFFVYKRFQSLVRADSSGEISKLSLLGDNVIIINAGSAHQPMLPNKAFISIEEPIVTNYLAMTDIAPAINQFTSIVTRLSDVLELIEPQQLKQSSRDLQTILNGVSKISDQIVQGKGSLGRLLYDKNQEQQIVNSLELLEKTLSGISQRVGDMQPIIANANQISSDAKQMLHSSQQLIIDVHSSVNKINQQLNQLPLIMQRAESVLYSGELTLNGLQPVRVHIDNKIWPLSTDSEIDDSELLIKEVILNE